MQITWLGHSAFEIKIAGKTVLVDPWVTGNPLSPANLSDITNVDLVYVTHDHSDHLGDAFDICKSTDALFVSHVELSRQARNNGVEHAIGACVGDCREINGLQFQVTEAIHTASVGVPTGIIISSEAKRVYHAGDTELFADMYLLRQPQIDLALLPIGGLYLNGMGAVEAVEAIKLIKPKAAIPMHYKTFPILAQSADQFIKLAKEKAPETKVIELKPGEPHKL